MLTLNPPVIARPFGARRQAIVSLGDTHMVIGSPVLSETNVGLSQPGDLLLATLATDFTFTAQEAAESLGLSLSNLSITTRWKPSERREIITRLSLTGLSPDQIAALIAGIQLRSWMYRLLDPAIPITFEAGQS
jgi:uncharacterized OsmC-like protein